MPKLLNIVEIDDSPVIFNLDSLAISALLAISISSPRLCSSAVGFVFLPNFSVSLVSVAAFDFLDHARSPDSLRVLRVLCG
jgi:hypothetical protein